ncbi:MAG: sporulation protein, partial [Angelakisella sp.]
MKTSWKRCKTLLTAAAVVLLAWLLLSQNNAAAEGARRGLSLCGTVIIPSLFPFLVLAAALPNLEAGLLLCAPARLLGGLYAAPPRLAPALLMSWLGGYPAGAKVLAGQLDAGELSSQNVERALCFCVNSGPAFLVTVVGLGLFGDLRV